MLPSMMTLKIDHIKKNDNYTMMTLSNTASFGYQIYEMAKWCQPTQCGKQESRRQFAFKTDAELTMFKLRWANELPDLIDI